jgi:hypothetical protein
MAKTPSQIEREIAAALRTHGHGRKGHGRRRVSHLDTPAVDGKTPLYGHTSESTAYLVADYPYGFRARTQIRYWLEHKKGKGFRFVSQTMNPKTSRWNKPKASTYADWGAAMYLNDEGHVVWEGIGIYTDGEKLLKFVRTFPGADMSEIRKIIPDKLKYLRAILKGDIAWTINGERTPRSEKDIAHDKAELETWEDLSVSLDQAA